MITVFRPFRILQKHWKLTLIAVFSLSIAMALGVLSLSLSNTFLLLPPSGEAPDRLVMILSRTPDKDVDQISYPDYKDYREKNDIFTDIAASPNSINMSTGSDGTRQFSVVSRPVSDNYFSVMGIRPFLGRFFAPGEDDAKTPIAVMTYACWQRMGSDSDIVGKKIANYLIIGVTPKGFTGSLYGLNGDLLTPLSGNDSSWFTKRSVRRLLLVARLKPGVTRRQAQTEMSALAGQLASAYPDDDKNVTTVVTRATMLPPDAISDAEWFASIFMALILLVLLIACANVANLLLAIAVGRRQEAAIKLALGAKRGRLIREFLWESALICAAGAVLGYGLAAALIRRYPNVTFSFPFVGDYSVGLNMHLDSTVALFTLALTLIAIVATGLAPALYASSPNLSAMLSGEIVVGGTRKNIRRNILVISQVAMCTLVLVGMGLCERSLYNERRVDPGFTARNLIAMQSPGTLSQDGSVSDGQATEFRVRVRAALGALPGVESVAFATGLPMLLGFNDTPIQISETGKKLSIAQTIVDGNYFDTLGIRLLEGRVFNSSDRANSPSVVVINRTMADTFWPGQDAVGQSLLAGEPASRATVIGITVDGKYESLDEPARAVIYSDLSQHVQPEVDVIARTKGEPRLWTEPIRKAVQALGVDAPLTPMTFNEWMNFSLIFERILTDCVALLSGLGLLLAALGLLGAISYSVSERKKELGIRVALGAQRRQLIQMILRQTLWITGAGVAIGILLGVAVTTLLRSEFYGIHPVEWPVLIPVSAVMIALSLIIAYISARPWLAVDPMEVIRHS